jgi:tRNA(Arg) A34 adenosine deaminase TadA
MSSLQDITAIIYDKRGKVLSIGKNSYVKTHPLQAKYANKVGLPEKQFLHAEIAAIVRCRDLSKAHKIEVYRIGRNGDLLLAKPCPVCESAIKASGIKHIEHT